MKSKETRIDREKKTVNLMISLYCNNFHDTQKDTCVECSALILYSNLRLEKCIFGNEKPNCSKCSVHCYNPKNREQIRTVMRYSGPRMIYKHPKLGIIHFLNNITFKKSV